MLFMLLCLLYAAVQFFHRKVHVFVIFFMSRQRLQVVIIGACSS